METRLALILLFVATPFVVLFGMIALFPWLSQRLGWIKPNYRGRKIPCGHGVVWWSFCTVVYGEIGLTADETRQPLAMAFLLTAFGFGLLGLVDDLWGEGSSKGISGHLRALAQGRITTGLLKAVGGLAVGMGAAWLLVDSWFCIAGGLLIALMANAINLLDLRPGRAVSVFLVLSLGMVIWLLYLQQVLVAALLGFLMAAALLLRRRDAAGDSMMGDVGSNLLGGVLGVAMVAGLPSWAQIVAGLLTVALHVVAERVSLSTWIESHSWLRRLDRLTGVR